MYFFSSLLNLRKKEKSNFFYQHNSESAHHRLSLQGSVTLYEEKMYIFFHALIKVKCFHFHGSKNNQMPKIISHFGFYDVAVDCILVFIEVLGEYSVFFYIDLLMAMTHFFYDLIYKRRPIRDFMIFAMKGIPIVVLNSFVR